MAATPRSYRSPLREEQARLTRTRILDAARELFLSSGYPGTTVAAIARHAGVAVDTVYATYGTKAALVKELVDVTVGGDDRDVALLDRAGPLAMRAEPDQHRQLEMFARGMSLQLERSRPIDDMLRSAAAVDPEIASIRADVQVRQRRQAMQSVASWVAARGPLRDGLTTRRAGEAIWALTSPEMHRMLRDDCAWTAQRYRSWLAYTLVRTLLP